MEDWAIASIVLGSILGIVAITWLASFCINPKVLDLDNKVVVITGGSSGIGLACAKEAASKGAHVALIARKQPGLDAAAEELSAFLKPDRRVTTISTDVTDDESCARAAEALAKEHGRVHMLIMSAGISEPGEFVRTDRKTWDRVFAVNVHGCRSALLALLPLLTAAGHEDPAGSRVCFVSSGAGLTGVYGFSAYCASKFALFGLAQVLQQELLTSGVRVGLHFPPDTDTPLLTTENLAKPELTKALSETISVLQAEDVARTLVRDSCRGLFMSAHDLISWLLVLQTAGMGPTPTVGEFVAQTLLAGFPLKIVALVNLVEWFGKIRARHGELVAPVILGAPNVPSLAALASEAGHAFPASMGTADTASAADAAAATSDAGREAPLPHRKRASSGSRPAAAAATASS